MARTLSIRWIGGKQRGIDGVDFIASTGARIPIILKRYRGARHFRLSLDLANHIRVSAPLRASEKSILMWVESQRNWLEAQIVRLPRCHDLFAWLGRHPHLSAGGRRYVVKIAPEEGSAYRFVDSDTLLFAPRRESESSLRRLVRRFATEALSARTAFFGKIHYLHFARVTVRDQSSRWGSCSARGAISLNWRLILLPPDVQDYVILHELAHLREMNHGAPFWQFLATLDPACRGHESQLSSLSPTVMRIARGEKCAA
jgi:predicted metal-dependent hydrolase